MNRNEKLKEEVQFWLSYINEWERNRDEPIPDKARLLFENAILKLESEYPNKRQTVNFQSNSHGIH